MEQRLYPNIKRMTNAFCGGIIAVTLAVLVCRLTFLSDMAITASPGLIQGTTNPQITGSNTAASSDYLINSKIYFASATAKGNVLITNTEQNEYYIRVDITVNDTGRSVYYSGDITPGTNISNARLQGDPLDEGEYACTATIIAYDPVTRDKVGQEEVPITIYVGVKPDANAADKEAK